MRESSCSDKCICTSVVFVMKFNKRLNFADKRVVPICFSLAKVSCFSVSVITVLQFQLLQLFQFPFLFSGVEFCSFSA